MKVKEICYQDSVAIFLLLEEYEPWGASRSTTMSQTVALSA
ncbi:MAG: hypothetical protein AAF939_07485 [Planctomycetota bacterium]